MTEPEDRTAWILAEIEASAKRRDEAEAETARLQAETAEMKTQILQIEAENAAFSAQIRKFDRQTQHLAFAGNLTIIVLMTVIVYLVMK